MIIPKVDIVVIGAGQAGLSSAYHLRRMGFVPDRDFVTFDHNPGPGGRVAASLALADAGDGQSGS